MSSFRKCFLLSFPNFVIICNNSMKHKTFSQTKQAFSNLVFPSKGGIQALFMFFSCYRIF